MRKLAVILFIVSIYLGAFTKSLNATVACNPVGIHVDIVVGVAVGVVVFVFYEALIIGSAVLLRIARSVHASCVLL